MDINFIHTYQADRPLFAALGLPTFVYDHERETGWHFIGLVDCKNAIVKVSVDCLPAQFWQFVIKTDDGKHVEIETGSGSLTTFWPIVEKFVADPFHALFDDDVKRMIKSDMIVVKKGKREKDHIH